MDDNATFTGPGGQDARVAIRYEIQALTTPTVGDLLFVGQVFRSRILDRTAKGVDVNGAPFVPYSTKGPYYFYPNREMGAARGARATADTKRARATAAKSRHDKIGRIGVRTTAGIRFESYAAAKAAHGVAGVNLFGMEQHTHMLNTIMVRAGGREEGGGVPSFGSDMEVFEGNTPARELSVGFYGPEAERAKGHNDGTSKLPKREFFALNQQDLDLAEQAVAQRMMIRARSGHTGPQGGGSAPAPAATSADPSDRSDWIIF